MTRRRINIVWLKRDLRLRDHAALVEAARDGHEILLIYIVEPFLLKDPHYSARHWRFIFDSIADINTQLRPYETQVRLFHTDAVNVFEALNSQFVINAIYSHQEVGLANTFRRDITVGRWCESRGVIWNEFSQNAVKRGLRQRSEWKRTWHDYYNQPCQDLTLHQVNWHKFEQPEHINHPFDRHIAQFQPGGELRAWFVLNDFFAARSDDYHKNISFPEAARRSCSRLSPYLAFGNLTTRQVYQYTRHVSQKTPQRSFSLKAFGDRIAWHDHFVQKFESECEMEFRSVNRAYSQFSYLDGPTSQYYFERWKLGKTGYPLVDACMRAVSATGYLNFRMRAMVVSFACHWLNLHWQRPAEYLASQFLDFEPGIHYPQIQMQAGITGTNTLRLYNPVKQSQDVDSQGTFIKKWVRELAHIPERYIHEPWSIPPMIAALEQISVPHPYDKPILDISARGTLIRQRLWAFRQREDVSKEAQRILARHTLPDRIP